MTDREKLNVWNKVCIKNKWSDKYELDSWLLRSGITFTPSGSAIPSQVFMLDNKYNIELQVNGTTGEGLATLVIQALSGIIIFKDLESEKYFWEAVKKRFKDQFDIKIPIDIIPIYLRKKLRNKINKKNYEKIELTKISFCYE